MYETATIQNPFHPITPAQSLPEMLKSAFLTYCPRLRFFGHFRENLEENEVTVGPTLNLAVT